MSKRKTTKRRKVWVNEYEHELGSIAWHTVREATNMEKEDVTGTVAFVEVRPGDVVLSREDAEELRRVVRAYLYADRNRALTLLRGRR